MASADFLRFVVTMLRFEFVYSYAPARPPRVSVITFTSYICCIYALNFGQYRTLFCLANSSISKRLFFMQFLFVRPRFCLRLLSDSASRRTPLSSANSSYCQACSGLSPPSCNTCRAHIQKSLSEARLQTGIFVKIHGSTRVSAPIVSCTVMPQLLACLFTGRTEKKPMKKD